MVLDRVPEYFHHGFWFRNNEDVNYMDLLFRSISGRLGQSS